MYLSHQELYQYGTLPQPAMVPITEDVTQALHLLLEVLIFG
jgi:hypothetical protein